MILDEPEPSGAPLGFVDIPAMVEKNREVMEQLIQNTIKDIYNTYMEYKNKVDVFYVAFSGGKDSVVTLDLVQRALPHNCFEAIFADTDMEFPTTHDVVEYIKNFCKYESIPFYIAKAEMSSSKTWDLFGAPARRIRWCCTVHKTAPVINGICERHKMDKICSVMITGVRGDESSARSSYDTLSLGKKIIGQYSFHPIIEWSSAEIYLYTYMQNLIINEAYKFGFSRVGCIMCPNSSERHEFFKKTVFSERVDSFCEKIAENSSKDLSGPNEKIFLETGGWKTRLSGRELKFSEDERFKYYEKKEVHQFSVTDLKPEWKIWYKTIGKMLEISEKEYILEYNKVERRCTLKYDGNITIFEIENLGKTKNTIEFIYYFKNILAKTQYCIQCKSCVAECPNRNINMNNGKLIIEDKCIQCHACLRMRDGCLYYNSVKGSLNMKSLKGINRYLSVGVDAEWIRDFMKDQSFEPGNRKTDVMYVFMNDAGVTLNKKMTDFGKFIQKRDFDDPVTWAIMLCNLAYSPSFKWYIKNIPFYDVYIESNLLLDMGEDNSKKDGGKKARGEFWNGFKVILGTNPSFQDIGLGIPKIESKTNRNGEVKKSLKSITRKPWQNPDPLVILYSLYKFAEACDGYYQFTLTRLLDHGAESNGVSPTEIFGLSRDTMEKILTGLDINYPDYISAQFTLDLDTISLSPDKTSKDVLSLF